MNKVALSLVSILILAVHLNWRDFTLFHASRDAQQSAIALIFEGLTLRDTRFPEGPPSPFGAIFQGGLQDCNKPPSTDEDLKRSEKDPTYWDGRIQTCTDEFLKSYESTRL